MNYKFTLPILGLISLCQTSFGQNAYRSKQTGTNYAWTTPANWEYFNGSTWVGAAGYPTSADDVITISASDSITLSTAIAIDQVIVNGTLAIFSATQTLNNGTGVDMEVNGKLHVGLNGILEGAGSLQVNATGTLSFLLSGARVRTATVNNGSAIASNPAGTAAYVESNNFINNGTFSILSGIFTIQNSEFINNGTFNIYSTSPDSYVQTSGSAPTGQFTNAATGTINKQVSGDFYFNRIVNNGLIKGIGVLDLHTIPFNNGVLEPGNSPGALSVPYNFFSGKTPTVNLEIVDGTGAGSGHDLVTITGVSANLSGTVINVTGNTAAPAGSYTVVTAENNFIGAVPSVIVPSGYSYTINANNIIVTKNIGLPVSWGEFNGFDESDRVRLVWSTIQEINASHFVVEFSADGTNFQSVANVSASGNTNTEKKYSYVHTTPSLTNVNFYRLRQVDIDGKFSYSRTITVKLKAAGRPTVKATPNPVRNSLQIIATQPNFKMILTDLNGKTLKTLQVAQGSQYLDVNELPTGTYYLLFSDGQNSFSQKIIKTR
ncbi:MAG: T9SS type A sorting domain-containing protein [Chitinophagaceae bacterium]